ncbi:hypothetical protein PIROE2DRAFT_58177 [Piromyces sp. E2]|nr:hypothetical protein PIROE2DRAFT_58177 [Piromyces sp. E2]|eukprot:OUM68302.1 hypothetical protein PIROE2DRAFT_58177 [Piromyces sp. E2]
MNEDEYDDRDEPETHIIAEKLLEKAVNIVFPKNEKNEKPGLEILSSVSLQVCLYLSICFYAVLFIGLGYSTYFKISAITGCILFSIYHGICALFYSAGQYIIPNCLRLPVDVAIGVIHFLIVTVEGVLCYKFGSKVIKYRSAWFVLLIKNENDKDEFSDIEDDDYTYDDSTQQLLRKIQR